MALQYEDWYDDVFVVGSVTPEDMEQVETDTLAYLDKLLVTDELFKRKACICGVYIELCRQQLENDGMQDKLDTYKKCWDSVIADATAGIGAGSFGIGSLSLGRA